MVFRAVGLSRLSTKAQKNLFKSGKTKQVLISESKCIFENLAFEDWMYKHADLSTSNYLLMWKNKPAVVVGRHQNPWAECDVNLAFKEKIDIARRNSGGGTVYHDEGNLNLSFLTARNLYDRRANLNFVKEAIQSRWDVNLKLNCRDDIVLNDFFKISGTAAKLGGDRSYHHFTLLVNVDKQALQNLLTSPLNRVKTRATGSVPSNIMNLQDSDADIDVGKVMDVICKEFLGKDNMESRKLVTPNDQDYPGYSDILKDLKSFQHVYGRTPDFTIQRQFVNKHRTDTKLDVSVDIRKGIIQNLTISTSEKSAFIQDVISKLTNVPFLSSELLPLFNCLEDKINQDTNDDKYFCTWISESLKMMLNIDCNSDK